MAPTTEASGLERVLGALGAFSSTKLVQVLLVVGAALIALVLARVFLQRVLSVVVRRSSSTWDDALFDRGVFSKLAYLAPGLVLHNFAELLVVDPGVVRRFLQIYLLGVTLLAFTSALTAANDVYARLELAKTRPLKGYVQIIKLLTYIAGGVVILALLLDRSPWAFLSGIGAMTAVLLLIFRDTILSFVASVQVASNDTLRIGDWIELPKFGADGDVVDIALHTFKVQNWDKTITTIPMHTLLEEPVKNWRGMQEAGGRRIKRALYVDQTSVGFLEPAQIERLAKIAVLREYIERKQDELRAWNEQQKIDPSSKVNGRRLTNLGTFRAYIEAYLRNHPKIRSDLTLIVRQLQPGAEGIPIEVYCFTNDTRWAAYEGIQADIFDHLLAVISEFDLRVFQRPSGQDLKAQGPAARAAAD
jgi:miniconductance mechanosensitive channel